MSICLLYINIDNEPIFPRTEERLRVQAKELADHLGMDILDFDHRKEEFTFGWHAIGILDGITVMISYPSSLEEDDDWNEVVADDRYNLYVVFRLTCGSKLNIGNKKYTDEEYMKEEKFFDSSIRNIIRKNLPSCYHVYSKEYNRFNEEPYINENFMNEE